MKYAPCSDPLLDQLKEPFALPAAAPEVVPFERCVSTDPPPPPKTVWRPAVAD